VVVPRTHNASDRSKGDACVEYFSEVRDRLDDAFYLLTRRTEAQELLYQFPVKIRRTRSGMPSRNTLSHASVWHAAFFPSTRLYSGTQRAVIPPHPIELLPMRRVFLVHAGSVGAWRAGHAI
jgi:hypothetical protein